MMRMTLLSLLAGAVLFAAESVSVLVKVKPGDKGKEYPTRTIEHLAGFIPETALPKTSSYGGDLARKTEARGFFYVKKDGDRWWPPLAALAWPIGAKSRMCREVALVASISL